jgi:integrase
MRVQLTDRFVATTKTDSVQAEFFDTKVKGLSLRVSRAGARRWHFHYTGADGKRARTSLGTYPATPLAAARTAAIEARSSLEMGNDPRAGKLKAPTVTALVDSYLAKRVLPNLRSADAIKRRLRGDAVPIIGAVKLADLHRRDINKVIDELVTRNVPAKANRTFADLRAMLRWAVKRGDMDHDPTSGMSMPSKMRSRDRVLSDAEMRRLWHSNFASADTARVLRLALLTAQRVGEVAGMTRAELDIPGREWRLPGIRTKNGRPHTVPLSNEALEIIGEAIVACGDRATLFDDARRLAHRLRRQFPDVDFTPHDLRRSALTGMARLGVEPIVLGHIANHLTTTKAGVTLGVYVQHGYEAEKRRALELWADRLSAIISGKPTADVVAIATT